MQKSTLKQLSKSHLSLVCCFCGVSFTGNYYTEVTTVTMPSGRYVKRSVSIPEDDTVSYNSDDDRSVSINLGTSASRFSTSQWPRFSQISVNPTPRVSDCESPREAFVRKENGNERDVDYRTPTLVKALVVVLSIVIIMLGVIIVYITALVPNEIDNCDQSKSKGTFIALQHNSKPGPFDDLTEHEYKSILNYIMGNKALNVTQFNGTFQGADQVYMIEAVVPDKDDVIEYLKGLTDEPQREAKVTVIHDSRFPPAVIQYIVSPTEHPISIKQISDESDMDTQTRQRFNARFNVVERKLLMSTIVKKTVKTIFDLLSEQLDTNCYRSCVIQINCCVELLRDNQNFSNGSKRTWAIMFKNRPVGVNIPTGLSFLIDHSSMNVTEWEVIRLNLNGNLYDSISEFTSAFGDLNYTKRTFNSDLNEDVKGDGASSNNYCLPKHDMFIIQKQQIFYRNWAFYYSLSPSRGLVIYNVRFEWQQVAYEISLQSIEVEGSNGYSSYIIGEAIQPLMQGINCPYLATYIESQQFINIDDAAKSLKRDYYICVYESHNIQPSEVYQKNPYFTRVEENVLTVRSVYMFGESSYTLDYIFGEGGSITTNLWSTDRGIHYFMSKTSIGMSSEEVEVLDSFRIRTLFKIDMDVNGPPNSVSSLVPSEQQKGEIGLKQIECDREGKSIDQTNLTNSVNINFVAPSSNSQYNTTGSRQISRVYRIVSMCSSVKTEMAASNLYSCRRCSIVTKYKRNETNIYPFIFESDAYNTYSEHLQRFVDDDELANKDVIIWISMESTNFFGRSNNQSPPSICSFSIAPLHN